MANKGRALIIEENVPIKMRYKVFCEAICTKTLADGLTAITVDGNTTTGFKHLFGTNHVFMSFLRTWGEDGTMKIKTATTPKLENCGVQCMFVGYAKNHYGGCYGMLNVEKLRILIEHDVIWLNRIYFDPAKVTQDPQVELIDNDNKKPIKSGDSVVKVIFDGDDGDNALTYVESDVDGITRDDGNVEGNTEYGDDTNDPTATDENTNADGGQG